MAQQRYTALPNATMSEGRILQTLFWAATHSAASFVQQVAEFFAPLALMAGILWKVAPAAANMLADKARTVSSKTDLGLGNLEDVVPGHFAAGGFSLTASSLIFYGVSLMAVAALASTVVAFAGRRL